MNKNIIFVGAGRLGTTLAKALVESGYRVPFFYSINFPTNFNSQLINTKKNDSINAKYLQQGDIVFITVPDDQIEPVAKQLAHCNIDWQNKIVIHCSACLSSSVLDRLKDKGAKTGSIHPMQTFKNCFLPATIFNDIYFAVEGDQAISEFFNPICKSFKSNFIQIKPDDKILYHIAAVGSSNFLVAILDYAFQLYSKIGLSESEIKKLLLPIARQTIENFSTNNSEITLTGPLKRKDWNTVKMHTEHLKQNQNDYFPVYKEISNYISQFILHLNESEKEKVKKILQ